MPKETFFRLPEEKKQRLIHAAQVEFSKYPLKSASVNQIIKLADIPRGSFYQYFEDIEDLYFYYFSLLRKNEMASLNQSFEASKGDFFLGIEIYFKSFLDIILDGPDREFYRHLFTNLDFHSSDRVMPYHGKNSSEKNPHTFGKELMKKIDLEKLDLENNREFVILFKLVMGIFFTSINDAYRLKEEEISKEEIIRLFQLRLNWLKYGAYRK